jgi:hypothetical protein
LERGELERGSILKFFTEPKRADENRRVFFAPPPSEFCIEMRRAVGDSVRRAERWLSGLRHTPGNCKTGFCHLSQS